MLFERSFKAKNPAKSQCWDYEKNYPVRPEDVYAGTDKKYWFICDICKHSFIKYLYNENWCPYCTNRKLCDNDNCNTCFKKSFASNKREKYWDYNKNVLIPRQVFLNPIKKYWFICNNEECKHSFDTYLYNE